MEELSVVSVASYCAFNVLAFYQKLHLKYYRGGKGFETLLALSAFAATATGITYLVWYGVQVVWWAPVLVFLIGLATAFASVFIERIVSPMLISMSAFILWPVFAYLMFTNIP